MTELIDNLIKRAAKAEAENIVLRMKLQAYEMVVGVRLTDAEKGNPFWWCATCSEEVDDSRVTYQERHDNCGNAVEIKYDGRHQ